MFAFQINLIFYWIITVINVCKQKLLFNSRWLKKIKFQHIFHQKKRVVRSNSFAKVLWNPTQNRNGLTTRIPYTYDIKFNDLKTWIMHWLPDCKSHYKTHFTSTNDFQYQNNSIPIFWRKWANVDAHSNCDLILLKSSRLLLQLHRVE